MASEEGIPDAPADRVRAIVQRVVNELDLEAEVSIEEAEDGIVARVDGEDLGLLIGRRGQTIDSLQLLCYRSANLHGDDHRRVTIDAAGYRDRRRSAVTQQADRAAERASATGREIELDPMSATERKIVHDHLAERPGVETFSEGDEPERFVVVAPLVSD